MLQHPVVSSVALRLDISLDNLTERESRKALGALFPREQEDDELDVVLFNF